MIKPLTSEDLTKCCELFMEVFNSPPWNDKWTSEAANVYLQELIAHKRFLGYALWEHNILIGAVMCHMKHHYRGDEVFVDEMFISSSHQRKGYGMRLMNHLENYAKTNSFISITLLTSNRTPAFGFYEKNGFKHIDHLVFMYKRI